MKIVLKFVLVEVVKIVCVCLCLAVCFPVGVFVASRLIFVETVLFEDKKLDLRSCFSLSWALSKTNKAQSFFRCLCLFVAGVVCLSILLTIGQVYQQKQMLQFWRMVVLLLLTNVVLIVMFVGQAISFATKNLKKAQQRLLSMQRE